MSNTYYDEQNYLISPSSEKEQRTLQLRLTETDFVRQAAHCSNNNTDKMPFFTNSVNNFIAFIEWFYGEQYHRTNPLFPYICNIKQLIWSLRDISYDCQYIYQEPPTTSNFSISAPGLLTIITPTEEGTDVNRLVRPVREISQQLQLWEHFSPICHLNDSDLFDAILARANSSQFIIKNQKIFSKKSSSIEVRMKNFVTLFYLFYDVKKYSIPDLPVEVEFRKILNAEKPAYWVRFLGQSCHEIAFGREKDTKILCRTTLDGDRISDFGPAPNLDLSSYTQSMAFREHSSGSREFQGNLPVKEYSLEAQLSFD